MSSTTPTPETVSDSPRSRARRIWVPITAGAAAIVAAAAIAVPLMTGGTPTVEQLALPGGGGISSGSCLPVSVDTLQAQEQAFAARVLTVEGDLVTFEVTERFAGEVADRVTMPQVDELTSDFSLTPFEAGDTYLVTATDGTVTGCGLSGADTAELRAFYDEAFGS